MALHSLRGVGFQSVCSDLLKVSAWAALPPKPRSKTASKEDKFEAFLYDQKEQTEDPKILSKITAQADGLKALLVRIRKDMETKRNGK